MMNPYKVLGVKKNASAAKIKSAYRTLSKTLHPDMLTGDEERFKELSLAYEVLSDPVRRQRYDETGNVAPSRVTPAAVRNFLKGIIQSVIKAHDDVETTDVSNKIIQTIESGTRQAEAGVIDVDRRIKRATAFIARFKKKGGSEDDMVGLILKDELNVLLDEKRNVEDAMEMAKQAIDMLKTYKYKVDPTPEGPFSAGPTLHPRYGGRSGGFTTFTVR